jgi:hypothetical protein
MLKAARAAGAARAKSQPPAGAPRSAAEYFAKQKPARDKAAKDLLPLARKGDWQVLSMAFDTVVAPLARPWVEGVAEGEISAQEGQSWISRTEEDVRRQVVLAVPAAAAAPAFKPFSAAPKKLPALPTAGGTLATPVPKAPNTLAMPLKLPTPVKEAPTEVPLKETPGGTVLAPALAPTSSGAVPLLAVGALVVGGLLWMRSRKG